MLKVGTFLQLEESIESSITYKCRVVEKMHDRILVDYPINEVTNQTEIFSAGTKFQILFHGKNTVYSFPTEIIAKGREGNIPVLLLTFNTSNLEKIQRREFLRIQALLDVSIRSVEHRFSSFTTVTHDISGGGMAIIVDKRDFLADKDALLDILLVLPLDGKIEYLHLYGKIVRIHERPEKNYILSVKFDTIETEHQEKLVRFCLLKQLEERRKGLS